MRAIFKTRWFRFTLAVLAGLLVQAIALILFVVWDARTGGESSAVKVTVVYSIGPLVVFALHQGGLEDRVVAVLKYIGVCFLLLCVGMSLYCVFGTTLYKGP